MCRKILAEAFRLAGDTMQREGAWERAMQMYSLSLDLSPDNLTVLHNRADMNLKVFAFPPYTRLKATSANFFFALLIAVCTSV